MATAQYPPETYTAKEQQALEEFRNKLTDLQLTSEQLHDAQLIRWLRARNLDIGKAHEMLKKHLEWRKEHNVDGILESGEDFPDDVKKTSPLALCGLDKEGYPILVFHMGRQDLRARLEKYGADKCNHFNILFSEKLVEILRERSKEQGRQVTQFVEICDMEGFGYRQLTSKLFREFLVKMQTQFDANYPEVLRFAMVVNAPRIFYIMFNILKPFIAKQTLEKIDIYGPDPEKWKKVVAERFPLELIPPHWGGTREGSDEFCSQSDIWFFGPQDVNYLRGTAPSSDPASDDSTLTPATINAREHLKVELVVTKPNCSICWSFRTQSHDISFEILGEDGIAVIPPERLQSQEGSVACDSLGSYTAVFDNSYSWTTAKKLWYSVSVLDPEELECSETIPLDSQ